MEAAPLEVLELRFCSGERFLGELHVPMQRAVSQRRQDPGGIAALAPQMDVQVRVVQDGRAAGRAGAASPQRAALRRHA